MHIVEFIKAAQFLKEKKFGNLYSNEWKPHLYVNKYQIIIYV